MNKNLMISGIVSLALAAVVYLVDLTKLSFAVGATSVRIYPAAFLALLGLVLIFWSFRKQTAS